MQTSSRPLAREIARHCIIGTIVVVKIAANKHADRLVRMFRSTLVRHTVPRDSRCSVLSLKYRLMQGITF